MPRSPVSLFVVAALATIPACADHGDESILITKNVAVTNGCSFSGDPAEAGLPAGQINVLTTGGYQFHPQLISRIITDTTVVGSDLTHTIIVQGADVDLTFADPTLGVTGGGFSTADLKTLHDSGLTHFQAPFSVTLPPNNGVTDGSFDMISTDLIKAITDKNPDALGGTKAFETTIIANVTVFGDMSGDHVVSQPFQYPVTVCNNCVINVVGTCKMLSATATVNPGNACNRFQDGELDCCTDMAGALVCPAVGLAM